jgi:hypothetical protein
MYDMITSFVTGICIGAGAVLLILYIILHYFSKDE